MNKCPNVNYFNAFSEHKCATKPKTKFMKKKRRKKNNRQISGKKINEKRGKKRRNADRRQRRRTIEKHRMSGCRSN